jgi:uncharacterized membrane protein YfcA
MGEPVPIVTVNLEALSHYLKPQTALFGIGVAAMLYLLLVFITAWFMVKPKKYISESLKDTRKWTPEMLYLANTRLVIGFLSGMFLAGVICVLIYAPWRV